MTMTDPISTVNSVAIRLRTPPGNLEILECDNWNFRP